MAEYAHSLGKKVYVTVNIFAHNEDIDRLPDYLRGLQQAKVDALLISDFGVWSTARQVVPDMPLHVSTQANTTNYAAVQAWEQLGAERVVLARELSLAEISEISEKTSVELETFVHGAYLPFIFQFYVECFSPEICLENEKKSSHLRPNLYRINVIFFYFMPIKQKS